MIRSVTVVIDSILISSREINYNIDESGNPSEIIKFFRVKIEKIMNLYRKMALIDPKFLLIGGVRRGEEMCNLLVSSMRRYPEEIATNQLDLR